jgi:hypothetical protein
MHDAGAHQASVALRGCAEAASGPVETIVQVITRLNALPRPVSVPCFVATLGRPLELVATTSVVSAQPAGGPDSPRIFALGSGLALSVVPAGAGVQLIELGEWQTTTRTLKGELELPVSSELAADAAFMRIEQSNQTTRCGICHGAEAPHPTIADAYVSTAFRPEPGSEVKVTELVTMHQACVDSGDTGERCELFHALFDFGWVQQGAFSRDVQLFIP